MAQTPTTKATAHHSYVKVDLSQYDEEQLNSMAIRPVAHVVQALMTYYDGDLFKIDGNDYIPWNITAQLLNDTFGYFGWSTKRVAQSRVETEAELGFEVVLSLTVSARMPDGTVVYKMVENNGYARVNGTFNKAVDTAIKAAFSDALSRCAKLLGYAFGLYLYEKETFESAPADAKGGYTPRNTTQNNASNFPQQPQKPQQQQSGAQRLDKDGKPYVGSFTSKQAYKLMNGVGLSKEEVESIDRSNAQTVMKIAFGEIQGDIRQYIPQQEVASGKPW